MIPQEINPVRNLSVASNVFLGREFVNNYGIQIVNQRKMEEKTRELFAGVLTREEATQEKILQLAAGTKLQA